MIAPPAELEAPQASGARSFPIVEPSDFAVVYPVRRLVGPEQDAPEAADVDVETLRRLMETMLWSRAVTEHLHELSGASSWTLRNDEAILAGVALALSDQDWVAPDFDESGLALARGMSLEALVANHLGTSLDPVKGRQVPGHWADRAHRLLSVGTLPGTQLPHAVGAAWAGRLRGERPVALSLFSVAACSSPEFHNALNFAGVYEAPAVFVGKNDQWALETSVLLAGGTMAQKAIGYGLWGERADGHDVLAVYLAARDAVERAREGRGATLLEVCVAPPFGSSEALREDVEPWMHDDPIDRFRRHLERRQAWTPEDDLRLEGEVETGLDEATKAAREADTLARDTMFDDVFAGRSPALEDQAWSGRRRES